MKEFILSGGKVFITSDVADSNRVIRRMNLNEGIDTINLKVLSPKQIAQELVMAYSAWADPDRKYIVMDNKAAEVALYSILKSNRPDFIPKTAVTMKTTAEIYRIINIIRMNRETDEYNSSSDKKVSDIRHLIEVYENSLKDRDLLDEKLLYEKAVEYLDKINDAKELQFLLTWTNGQMAIDADMESDVSSRVNEFITAFLEKAGGIAEKISLAPQNNDSRVHFFKGYGAANEIKYITSQIQENRYPYGEVAISFAGSEYENLLKSDFDVAGIPYTFSSGAHASANDRVSFMRALIHFAMSDYSYEELRNVVHHPSCKLKGVSKCYRSVLRDGGIGWGMERYKAFFVRYDEKEKNALEKLKSFDGKNATEEEKEKHKREEEAFNNKKDYVSFLKKIIEVFECKNPGDILNGLLKEIVDKYAADSKYFREFIREDIKSAVYTFKMLGEDENSLQLLDDYLKDLTVSEKAEAGSVVIIPYGKRGIYDRKYMFAAGLSRQNIEAVNAESSVLSDMELKKYAEGNIDTAEGRNKKKRQNFERLIKGSDFSDVWLGYSEYDTVKLLDSSPSALYTEYMDKNEGGIEFSGYERSLGKIKISKDDFYTAWDTDADQKDLNENGNSANTPVYFSSSSLQKLINCPLEYHYEKHKRIKCEEFIKRNGHEWLPANARGNLFHYTVEDYGKEIFIKNEKSVMDDDFLKECFDRHVKEMEELYPEPSEYIKNRECRDSYDAIVKYIKRLHEEINASGGKKKVLGCEVGFEGLPYKKKGDIIIDEESGKTVPWEYDIEFGGSADRVDGELGGDGILKVTIYDYKTGKVEKKEKEITENLWIQHFVYAAGVMKWLEENKSEIEKRYGKEIKETEIEKILYIFPQDKESDGTASIDATEVVGDPELHFPENVDECLQYTEGLYQTGNPLAEDMMEEIAQNRYYAELNEKNDLCMYCGYKDICRLQMRLRERV